MQSGKRWLSCEGQTKSGKTWFLVLYIDKLLKNISRGFQGGLFGKSSSKSITNNEKKIENTSFLDIYLERSPLDKKIIALLKNTLFFETKLSETADFCSHYRIYKVCVIWSPKDVDLPL